MLHPTGVNWNNDYFSSFDSMSMRTVRCKTWDSFTVTPNRRQHRAALRLTGSMTVAAYWLQTIKRFAQTLIDRDWKKGTFSTFRKIESGPCA